MKDLLFYVCAAACFAMAFFMFTGRVRMADGVVHLRVVGTPVPTPKATPRGAWMWEPRETALDQPPRRVGK